MQQDIKHTPSSGNVFADIGLPDADALLVDADRRIAQRLQREQQRTGARSVLRRLLQNIFHPYRMYRRRHTG